MTEAAKTYIDFAVPPSIISRIDLSRLVIEVEQLDNEMIAAAGRAGKVTVPMPEPSSQLTDFLSANQLTLTDGKARAELIKQLRLLKDHVPVIHMTFAVVADKQSLSQISEWLRTTIHPQAVITVGLQPGLVAGVYLRTPNHVHDFSLRAKLQNSHEVLMKELGALRGAR